MELINSWDSFQRFKTEVGKTKPLNSRLEDGFVCLSFPEREYKIPGHWDEPQRTEVLEHLASLDETLFSALKEKKFIFGKCPIERIVSIEVGDNYIETFKEMEDGTIESDVIPYKPWVLAGEHLGHGWIKLRGYLHYKYIKYWDNLEQYKEDRKRLYKRDTFSVWDDKEAAMIHTGITYFKGMKVEDVSVLSFDIETSGLTMDSSSFVFCISNTFRKRGELTKVLFSSDEYETQGDMFDAWCAFVREVNPAILIAHNGFGYDLPYLKHCANMAGVPLALGRDGSDIRFDDRSSKFRKDGSQDYEYKRCYIYGREIVDTMFLAYHYDFARKYESYGLKVIIKQEGLEKTDRQFYDASQIGKNWHDPVEREKIKKYVIDDSDDALALYDLMIPSYFYLSQSVPKTFQVINYSATGALINAFLIRSYLQDGHSIPKTNESGKFVGAISIGNPGVYSNCWKQDVASLYPSVILQYNVYDKIKDPKQHFLHMVKYFTKERLKNKMLAKDTGNRYYTDLEQSQKIFINSSYGLLGATGLIFNSPHNAAMVTEKGREILKKAILWATGQEFTEKSEQDDEDENATE